MPLQCYDDTYSNGFILWWSLDLTAGELKNTHQMTCIARKIIYNPWMFLTMWWWMQTNLMWAGRRQTVNRNVLRLSQYGYTPKTENYHFSIIRGWLSNKHWGGKKQEITHNYPYCQHVTTYWIVACVRTSINGATQQVRGKGRQGSGPLDTYRTGAVLVKESL